jgi:DGQHR domain-containing protein
MEPGPINKKTGNLSMSAKKSKQEIVIRALRTTQGKDLDVFAFFVKGADIVKVADISRIERTEGDLLKGFQRTEIRNHVKGIVEYLNLGNVLFPNAIILAMSPEVVFKASRGTKPTGDESIAESGTLTIPINGEGNRVAWIVDGQQRSLALAQARDQEIPVPVIGFVSNDLEIQREQFILVNKAKPLPGRLINELLPETSGFVFPKELSSRKIPSELCNLLNQDKASPFYKTIKRISDEKKGSDAVITDTALISMIRNSLNNPLGALAPYRGATSRDGIDINGMYKVLCTFWQSVKEVFPDAWGKDPRRSRLMHSAGILAMGVLMDRIYARLSGVDEDIKSIKKELTKIEPHCHWTSGTWELIGTPWNEIQNTPRDIKKLQDVLVRTYTHASR